MRGGIVGGGTPGTANGITISTSDTAHLQQSNISNNSSTGLSGYALQINANGSSTVDNLTVTQNDFSKNDGGIQINRADSSTVQAAIYNNNLTQNAFNGMSFNASGTNVSGMNLTLIDNTVTGNSADGMNVQTAGAAVVNILSQRSDYSTSGQDNLDINTDGTSVLNFTAHNITANDAFANGFSATTKGFSTLNLTVDSPFDTLFTGTQSSFATNGANGMVLNTNDASLLRFTLDKTTLNSNVNDGLLFNRSDTSLIAANITNVTMNSNTVNGFGFRGFGADPQDPNQPFTNTPNLINMTNVSMDQNGTNGVGDGARVELFGDSQLVLNLTTATLNQNAGNGFVLTLTPGAQFGYQLGNQRSTFDNVQITNNGGNGIFMYSNMALNDVNTVTPNQADSLTFMEINSNSGDTNISGNGGNGILMQYPGGVHDVLIVNNDPNPIPAHNVRISNNTLDGIHVDSGISGNPNVTLDGVIVGGPGATDGNKGDGVDFEVTSRFTVVDRSYQFTWNTFGASDGTLTVLNSTIQGNTGTGIKLIGNALNGLNLTQDDHSIDGLGFLQAYVSNTKVANNGGDGVSVDLSGQMQSTLVFDGNSIVSNGGHGFFLTQNPATQIRGGNTFRRIQFQDPQPTNPAAPFDPNNLIGTSNWNQGYNTDILGGSYLSNYMNLTTDLNTSLTLTNNQIQYNGTSGVLQVGTGDGVYLRVGTDSKLSADIQNNNLGGNLANDLHIESFVAYNPLTGAAITPPASTSAQAPAPDVVFLDDTAQLDLRLVGNIGNTVNIVDPFSNYGANRPGFQTPNGAFYPIDPLKNNFGPNFLAPRLVQLFQVDNGNNLDSLNNFSQNGIQQSLENAFFNASYHLRATADPLFPNPAFPQDYNASPGDPFLP